ncbi:MAG TPA: M67 family metallopeptidase [Gemmataceae bacterium]|nr:M67 family metallopeptidase [Gemmataceae bacterium]
MSTLFRLQIPRRLYEGVLEQARAEFPNECCGLLAGRLDQGPPPLGRAVRRYPLVNAADCPARRYYADEKSLVNAVRDLRERGLDVLAIYHSHPTSDPVPSRTDLEQNYWPGVVSLIISLKADVPCVRGWWLADNTYHAAEWEVVPDEEGPAD